VYEESIPGAGEKQGGGPNVADAGAHQELQAPAVSPGIASVCVLEVVLTR
jgi:hypothetical protein